MPVFLELVTDAFQDAFKKQKRTSTPGRTGRAGASRVRRPLRGLEIKDDTYACVRVVGSDGISIPLFDSASSTGMSEHYTSFILQSVQEARMEKHQIVDTFGEPYIFFFGEQPRFLDCTAILVNSHDFNWEAEFWENYETYLRGTRLVEQGARVYLLYDDTIVEGYWLQAQAQKTSDQPLMIQLSFRLFITSYSNISLVPDGNFPIRDSVNLPASIDLTTADGWDLARADVEAAGAAANEEALASMATQGASEQVNGFGGGKKLTDALRGGLSSASDITGIVRNAEALLGDMSGMVRTGPVRSKIADNADEFTALLPAPPADGVGPYEPIELSDWDNDMNELDDELFTQVTEQMAKHGAVMSAPAASAPLTVKTPLSGPSAVDTLRSYRLLGFLPTFVAGGSVGMGGWARATFGPVADFGAVSGFGLPSVPTRVLGDVVSYSAGVQSAGGLSGGVGLGGGVAGGFRTQLATPSGRMTGAACAQGASLGSSYAGAGMGASVRTGGVPSLFATAVVEGTLDEYGQTETHTAGAWFIADETGTHSGSYAK